MLFFGFISIMRHGFDDFIIIDIFRSSRVCLLFLTEIYYIPSRRTFLGVGVHKARVDAEFWNHEPSSLSPTSARLVAEKNSQAWRDEPSSWNATSRRHEVEKKRQIKHPRGLGVQRHEASSSCRKGEQCRSHEASACNATRPHRETVLGGNYEHHEGSSCFSTTARGVI